MTSLGLLFSSPVFGQDDTADVQEEEAVMVPPAKEVKQSELSNWLFAGGSLVAATIAVLLVAWSPGKAPPPGEAVFPQ